MPKKIEDKKIESKAGLTQADVEIIRERIANMTPEEQVVVAMALDSSIMENELVRRRSETGDAIRSIAEQIRRVDVKWAK